MKNKVEFYLAGGMGKFGKENFNEGNEWRLDLKSQLETLSDGKAVTINPNDHFNFLDDTEYESQREVMEYDLHRVRNADVIIVNFNDPSSIGTQSEIAISYEMKKPILGLCESINPSELHPWQQCMCNRIFTDREDLVLYIIKHYIS